MVGRVVILREYDISPFLNKCILENMSIPCHLQFGFRGNIALCVEFYNLVWRITFHTDNLEAELAELPILCGLKRISENRKCPTAAHHLLASSLWFSLFYFPVVISKKPGNESQFLVSNGLGPSVVEAISHRADDLHFHK